jgi:hypothetical protein
VQVCASSVLLHCWYQPYWTVGITAPFLFTACLFNTSCTACCCFCCSWCVGQGSLEGGEGIRQNSSQGLNQHGQSYFGGGGGVWHCNAAKFMACQVGNQAGMLCAVNSSCKASFDLGHCKGAGR